MISQARLKLGRLHETQNQPDKAKAMYEEVTRSAPFGAVGAEAGARLQAVLAKHPELATPRVLPTNAPAINLSQP
jgi:predicted nicotinamide N-methyase